jgi:peptide subunit release factor RF-3
LSVGDSLSEGGGIQFSGIPNFAPEIIRRVSLPDAMKAKQLVRALNDLAEEGVTQVFQPMSGGTRLVGVVGPLQLEVLSSRLENEYGVTARFEDTPYQMARWIAAEDPANSPASPPPTDPPWPTTASAPPSSSPAAPGCWSAPKRNGPTSASTPCGT